MVAMRSLCTKKARGGGGAPLLQYRGLGEGRADYQPGLQPVEAVSLALKAKGSQEQHSRPWTHSQWRGRRQRGA